jgi:replication initiation and membrane attachment protein DnaB
MIILKFEKTQIHDQNGWNLGKLHWRNLHPTKGEQKEQKEQRKKTQVRIKEQAPKWVTLGYRINHVRKLPPIIRNILEKNGMKSLKNK